MRRGAARALQHRDNPGQQVRRGQGGGNRGRRGGALVHKDGLRRAADAHRARNTAAILGAADQIEIAAIAIARSRVAARDRGRATVAGRRAAGAALDQRRAAVAGRGGRGRGHDLTRRAAAGGHQFPNRRADRVGSAKKCLAGQRVDPDRPGGVALRRVVAGAGIGGRGEIVGEGQIGGDVAKAARPKG